MRKGHVYCLIYFVSSRIASLFLTMSIVFPYFFMIVAGFIALAIYPIAEKSGLAAYILLLLIFLVLISYLHWTEKVPPPSWDFVSCNGID